jgi:PTH1 family peptidyl-tRNA hydrolase
MVAGLGNPGAKYARTRHNAGFIVVDELARRWDARDWKKKHEARYALDRERGVLLVEPQSFMNLSGDPVLGLATFYKIPPQRILVIVGHNGLKSLIEALGPNFARLRVGIGRGHDDDAIDRVLSPFTAAEADALPAIVERAVEGVELWLERGIVAAMNRVNANEPPAA